VLELPDISELLSEAEVLLSATDSVSREVTREREDVYLGSLWNSPSSREVRQPFASIVSTSAVSPSSRTKTRHQRTPQGPRQATRHSQVTAEELLLAGGAGVWATPVEGGMLEVPRIPVAQRREAPPPRGEEPQ
jgi:hypothetical protein